eukprot:1181783-Alexandrium_andersonii.AAC.1
MSAPEPTHPSPAHKVKRATESRPGPSQPQPFPRALRSETLPATPAPTATATSHHPRGGTTGGWRGGMMQH